MTLEESIKKCREIMEKNTLNLANCSCSYDSCVRKNGTSSVAYTCLCKNGERSIHLSCLINTVSLKHSKTVVPDKPEDPDTFNVSVKY